MPSYASDINGWVAVQLCSGASVGPGSSWVSDPLDAVPYKYFGIHYCTPGTTPHVQIDMLGATSTVDGMTSPASTQFVVPDGASAINSDCSDSAWHVVSLQPPPVSHLKVRATGLGSGSANTTLTVKFFAKV